MKRIITQYPDYREYAPINTQVNVYYSAADEQDLIDDSVDIVTKHRMYEDFKYFFIRATAIVDGYESRPTSKIEMERGDSFTGIKYDTYYTSFIIRDGSGDVDYRYAMLFKLDDGDEFDVRHFKDDDRFIFEGIIVNGTQYDSYEDAFNMIKSMIHKMAFGK